MHEHLLQHDPPSQGGDGVVMVSGGGLKDYLKKLKKVQATSKAYPIEPKPELQSVTG